MKEIIKDKEEEIVMENKLGEVLKNGETIVNCTPHKINVKIGDEVVEIQPSPEYNIKLETKQTPIGNTIGGLEVHRQEMIIPDLNNILPKKKTGVIYIVALVVADLCRRQRSDVFGINNDTAPRNDKGWVDHIVGLIQY